MPVPDPPPPDQLRAITPAIFALAAGTELWRIYARGGDHPTTWDAFRTFGPTNLRFDHHLPPPRSQERGILYAAEQALTCFAEVFQDARTIDPDARAPWLVSFRTRAPLDLLDLRGLWPTQAGGSQEINTGDREKARIWSRAISLAYPDIHGLYYPSKMHGGAISLALYERSQSALPRRPLFHLPLAAGELTETIANAASDLGYLIANPTR